jgi:hypothetical protein
MGDLPTDATLAVDDEAVDGGNDSGDRDGEDHDDDDG